MSELPGQSDRIVVTARDAAAANANKLAREDLRWRHTMQLGLAAITHALIDVADAVREVRRVG